MIDSNGVLSTSSFGTIQEALDYAYSNTIRNVVIPPGIYNECFVIRENINLKAYGAIIDAPYSSVKIKMESNTKLFGIEIIGAGNTSFNGNDRAIEIIGSLYKYVDNVTITDCNLHDLGGYGIYSKFNKNVNIERVNIKNVGYAGILGTCVENYHCYNLNIDGIYPGLNNNAYGVAFTRETGNDLLISPRSKNCSVRNSIITNIPTWEGLDTHAGENIEFSNNTIINCKVGIALVPSHVSGVDDWSPQFCKAINNIIYGTGQGSGIIAAGANFKTGEPKEYFISPIISGNIIQNYGSKGVDISGGVLISNTLSCLINNNSLNDCYAIGINVYHDNQAFIVSDNSIINIQDDKLITVSGICVRSSYNKGNINNNIIMKNKEISGVNINKRGVWIATNIENYLKISDGINNADLPYYGTESNNITFGTFGQSGGNIYSGLNSPEGLITANPTSIYLKRNGGLNSTLYVKETGNGNTGWVAK